MMAIKVPASAGKRIALASRRTAHVHSAKVTANSAISRGTTGKPSICAALNSSKFGWPGAMP